MKKLAHKRSKRLLFALIAIGSLQAGSAWADCGLISGQWRFQVDAARAVIVDPTLPSGTPVGRGGEGSNTWRFNCAGVTNPVYVKWGMTTASPDNTYELLVDGQPAGVGLRVSVSIDGGPLRPLPVDEQMH